MDLLRAEHGVGKGHRSQQTRTKLEEPRCAAEGEGGEEGRIGQPGRRRRRACQGAPGPGSQVPSVEPGRGRGSGAGRGPGVKLGQARPSVSPWVWSGAPTGVGVGGSQIWRGPRGRRPEVRAAEKALTAPPLALKTRANRSSQQQPRSGNPALLSRTGNQATETRARAPPLWVAQAHTPRAGLIGCMCGSGLGCGGEQCACAVRLRRPLCKNG